MSAAEQEETERLNSNLKNYLTGYGRGGPEPLQLLLASKQWQCMAQQELDRRHRHFFECLDTEVLEALANGNIDLHQSIKSVLDQDLIISS